MIVAVKLDNGRVAEVITLDVTGSGFECRQQRLDSQFEGRSDVYAAQFNAPQIIAAKNAVKLGLLTESEIPAPYWEGPEDTTPEIISEIETKIRDAFTKFFAFPGGSFVYETTDGFAVYYEGYYQERYTFLDPVGFKEWLEEEGIPYEREENTFEFRYEESGRKVLVRFNLTAGYNRSQGYSRKEGDLWVDDWSSEAFEVVMNAQEKISNLVDLKFVRLREEKENAAAIEAANKIRGK